MRPHVKARCEQNKWCWSSRSHASSGWGRLHSPCLTQCLESMTVPLSGPCPPVVTGSCPLLHCCWDSCTLDCCPQSASQSLSQSHSPSWACSPGVHGTYCRKVEKSGEGSAQKRWVLGQEWRRRCYVLAVCIHEILADPPHCTWSHLLLRVCALFIEGKEGKVVCLSFILNAAAG